MNRVCVVTGTRAEYGILKPLIKRFFEDKDLELQMIATGMHLSPEFGLTYQEIEQDGYEISEKVEMLLSSDTRVGVAKSIGLGIIGFADAFERLKPNMVILLGDRFEAFAAATAAFTAHIPISHIHGGETTEGAIDEAFRHSITKMSYLHFASTACYKKRIIQLGEAPQRVFNVGAMGVENIKHVRLLKKEDLEKQLDWSFQGCTAVVTYHPVTLEEDTALSQFENLLRAVDTFKDLKIIFTKANADAQGRVINKCIDDYVKLHSDKARAFTSLGMTRYLSTVKYSQLVIGNSSSGIIEVPSLKVPVVNIGDRQKGRLHADSVIDCAEDEESIQRAICTGLSTSFQEKVKNADNPYDGGESSERIFSTIKIFLKEKHDLKKQFYDLKE